MRLSSGRRRRYRNDCLRGDGFINIWQAPRPEPDRDFCPRAVKEAGVAAIPVSAFYEADKVTSIARLCFSKGDATLDEGVARLVKARELSRAAA